MIARPLQIGVPNVWDEGFGEYLKTISTKYPLNFDHNSGDPLGMAVLQVSAHDGQRVTAAKALLSDPPSNLSIITESVVQRVILDEYSHRAIGVATPEKKS